MDVATELFAERGYGAVGTEEIVARAGVTRGALYHHFRDKRDLFRAVFERLEEGLVASIASQMAGVEDPWEVLVTGMRAALDAATEPAVIRISLLDAPAVLGWREWRDIEARHGLGLVAAGLRNAMDQGVFGEQESHAAGPHAGGRALRSEHAHRGLRRPRGHAARGGATPAGAAGRPAQPRHNLTLS